MNDKSRGMVNNKSKVNDKSRGKVDNKSRVR